MADWKDRFWNSADGDIRLHYRDYHGPHDRPPILCLPGLTRNARDFEHVAQRIAGDWRVLAVDFRGRGLSGYDPDPVRYMPPTYAADVLKLLDQLGIADAVFVGTSLGGIVTMLLAATDGERIAGALLNDVGPELSDVGLERIRGYVGKQVRHESWAQAAAALMDRNGDVYPDWGINDWKRFARRVMIQKDGAVQFDYDPRIADNVLASANAEPIDAWPLLAGLTEVPVTILRGELSDLLTPELAAKMQEHLPQAELVTIPRVGHAPSFDEPESMAALDRLLERVLAR